MNRFLMPLFFFLSTSLFAAEQQPQAPLFYPISINGSEPIQVPHEVIEQLATLKNMYGDLRDPNIQQETLSTPLSVTCADVSLKGILS